jgi:hypothetical protein
MSVRFVSAFKTTRSPTTMEKPPKIIQQKRDDDDDDHHMIFPFYIFVVGIYTVIAEESRNSQIQ